MKRHDAFLDLAAAALDYPLAPQDRARLGEHLQACAACSRAAAGMRADARDLQALPALALSTAQAEAVFELVRRPAPVRLPLRLTLAVALLGALLVGAALAAGSGLLRLPSPVVPDPAPLPAPTWPADAKPTAGVPSPPAPASPTPVAGAAQQVAYTTVECQARAGSPAPNCSTSSWLAAAADGGGARRLLGEPVGWSADGSRLLLVGETSLILADAAGTKVSEYQLWCNKADGACPASEAVLCAYPCNQAEGFALSPDATRVAFVRGYSGDPETETVVAVLDLASGRTAELAATRSTNLTMMSNCHKQRTCEGLVDTPRWSPDGRRIAFAKQIMSPEPGVTWTSGAVYAVDADGGNLRRVTPAGLVAHDPNWSADAARLVFTADTYVLNANGTTETAITTDVYTIGVEGTGLARLTDDGLSARGDWTSSGRVAFMRTVAASPTAAVQGFENWVMDADGGDPHRTGSTLSELTDAGCAVCVYPLSGAPTGRGPFDAYWQPAP